jgi:hypothetical protein
MFDSFKVLDSNYRKFHPNNLIVRGAVITDDEWNLLWSGDLDCTLDITILKNASKILNKQLFVLWSLKDYQIKSRMFVLRINFDFIELGYEVERYIDLKTLKYH